MATRKRKNIDPIWWAPVLFLVVGSLVALTAALFSGTFRSFDTLTLISDRTGLVMESGAKVNLYGVPIGRVASVSTISETATLVLDIDPEPFAMLPSDVVAEIKSSTAFGAKYVDLIVPEHSTGRLKPGAVVRVRNITVEINTVFENLQSLVQAVDPAKLNAVLSAFAEALRDKGDILGRAITDANAVLSAVNPRMATVRQDWRAFGQTADAYSTAAQNILSTLDSAATIGTTIADNSTALDDALLASIGFSRSGINAIGGNQQGIVDTVNLLEPTTDLLLKYQPTYTCLFKGAQWFLDNGGLDIFGGNGKSVILDSALLFGDDSYRYPQHLPRVNATGGPGGRPSCGSLPDPTAMYPVKALVTDTGWGTDPADIRIHPGLGHPWWVNYFPVTRAVPEPPSYHGQPR